MNAPAFTRTLIVSIVGWVAALGSVVLAAMLWQGVVSTREANRQHISAALDSVAIGIQELAHLVEMTAHSTERVVRSAGPENPVRLRRALEAAAAAFELRPDLSHLGLMLSDGSYGNLERNRAGEVLLWLCPATNEPDRPADPNNAPMQRLRLTDSGFVPDMSPALSPAPSPAAAPDAADHPHRARLREIEQTGQQADRAGVWQIRQHPWPVADAQAAPPWGISYTRALYDASDAGGQWLGVLDASFDMARVRQYLNAREREYGVRLELVQVDAAGNMANLPALPQRVGSDTEAPQAVPAAVAAILPQALAGRFVDALAVDGERRWVAAAPLALKGNVAGLIVASRQAPWLNTILGAQIWLMLAVLLVLATGLVWIAQALARRFGQPLAELVERVAGIGQGVQHATTAPATLTRFRETWLLADALDEADAAIARQTALTHAEQERLRALNVELQYRATHNPLTGLPNRALLYQRTTAAIAQARERGTYLALLYVDFDRFKAVNDCYGHSVGNLALKAAGATLARLVGPQDTVAHLSGDRFVILLTGLTAPGDAEPLTRHLIAGLKAPLQVDKLNVQLTATIGVSLYPQHGDTADALISHADIAMYAAKAQERGSWRAYDAALGEQAQQRIELELSLREAIEAGPGSQLHLVYQPQVNLATGRISGCEALLRWQHPTLGAVSPARFIPIAEESGLIMPLGDWVLQTACRQARAWLDAGLAPVRVAVNLSTRQFLQQDVVAWVADTLRRTGLPAACLELEITESLLPHDVEHAIATLQRLRKLGVTLALDDFGTGYSNLSYLKRFPLHTLKIDQSFVHTAASHRTNAAIVRTIILLARELGFKTLAEGVETDEQRQFLRAQGCDDIQGYCFSPPVSADEFAALMKKHE